MKVAHLFDLVGTVAIICVGTYGTMRYLYVHDYNEKTGRVKLAKPALRECPYIYVHYSRLRVSDCSSAIHHRRKL